MTSVLFASVHLDPVRWLLLVGLGLLLCRTFRRSGSLYGAIAHHALVNTGLALLLLQRAL